jgi:hypothetical protein
MAKCEDAGAVGACATPTNGSSSAALSRAEAALQRSRRNTAVLSAVLVAWATRVLWLSWSRGDAADGLSGCALLLAACACAVTLVQHERDLASVSETRAEAQSVEAKLDEAQRRLQEARREREALLRRLASSEFAPSCAASDGAVSPARSLSSSSAGARTTSSGAEPGRRPGIFRRLLGRARGVRQPAPGSPVPSPAAKSGVTLSSSGSSSTLDSQDGFSSSSEAGPEPDCSAGLVALERDNAASPAAGAASSPGPASGSLPFATAHPLPFLAASEIWQPPLKDEYAELQRRVADVMTAEMERKWGGPSRCYERFVRARKGDLAASEEMLRKAVAFRKLYELDAPASAQFQERERLARVHAHLWAGNFQDFTTADGSPVQLYTYRHLQPKQLMKQVSEEQFSHVYVAWMERTLDLQNQANSVEYRRQLAARAGTCGPPAPGREHEWMAFIEVHDLSGLGRQQLYMPGVLMLTRVLKLGQGNYPEGLRRCVICNAPWFFSAAWSLISKVLDPATRDKIVISSNVPRDRLLEVNLSEQQIDEIFASAEKRDGVVEQASEAGETGESQQA